MAEQAKADEAAQSTGVADAFKLSTEVKPISGATTLKNEQAGYPAELVAYSQLDDALNSAMVAVRNAKAKRILIVEDRAIFHADWPYALIDRQIDDHEKELRSARQQLQPVVELQLDQPVAYLVPPAIAPLAAKAASLLPSLAGAIIDLRGLFRTNYTIAGRIMTPLGTPVVAQMASLLLREMPGLVVNVDGFELIDDSPLLQSLSRALAARQELAEAALDCRSAAAAAAAQIKHLETRLDTLLSAYSKATDEKSVERLKARIDEHDSELSEIRASSAPDAARVAFVDAVLARFDGFLKGLLEPGEDSTPPLVAAMLRESLHADGGPTHVLFVSLDSIGSETATAESPLRSTDRIQYIGGLQCSYLLYDVNERRLVGADVERKVRCMVYDLRNGHWDTRLTNDLD